MAETTGEMKQTLGLTGVNASWSASKPRRQVAMGAERETS